MSDCLKNWPASLPLVVTIENNWINPENETQPSGRAFWVDSKDARAQIQAIALDLDVTWQEAGREWGARLGAQTQLNNLLTYSLCLEWRRPDRDSGVKAGVLRCISREELDEKEVFSILGLSCISPLPCSPEIGGFVGPSLKGWLEAIEALRERSALCDESKASSGSKAPVWSSRL